jgi:hypothetical protein
MSAPRYLPLIDYRTGAIAARVVRDGINQQWTPPGILTASIHRWLEWHGCEVSTANHDTILEAVQRLLNGNPCALQRLDCEAYRKRYGSCFMCGQLETTTTNNNNNNNDTDKGNQ